MKILNSFWSRLMDWSASAKNFDPNALYERPDCFFGPTERSFWDLLNEAAGSQYRVFGRTRLLDILSIKPGLDEGAIAIAEKQAGSRYVDFVLCDPATLSVAGAIELDGDQVQRGKSDAVTGRILAAAAIPFIRMRARSDYTALDVKLALMEKIPGAVSSSNDTARPRQPEAVPGDAKLCPACGAPLVKRTVKKGPNMGMEFWGCSTFPKCKTSLSLDEI